MAQRERKPGGKLEYHIKWLGYDNSHNSWEPASNILDPKLLEKWRQQQVCATPCQVGANHARLTHATPRHALSQASGASSSSGSTPSVAPKAASKGSRRASDLSTLSTLLTTVVDTLAPSDFSRHLPSRR